MLLEPLLSGGCVRIGPVKAEQGGARTGKRGINRGILVARGSHQMLLDFTQGGILRKDDGFKVVFDPGADKREKGIPGQIMLDTAPVLWIRTPMKLLIVPLRWETLQVLRGVPGD